VDEITRNTNLFEVLMPSRKVKIFFIIATTDKPVYNIKIVYITGQIYAITDMQCIITKIKKHQQIQLFTNNLYKLMSTTKNFLTKILNNIHFKRYTNTWNLTKLDEMNKKNIHKYIF